MPYTGSLCRPWKKQRFHRNGRVTYWETNTTLADRVADLVRRRGEVRVTSISGKPAAIDISFRAGETSYIGQQARRDRAGAALARFVTQLRVKRRSSS